jgi:prephenate dehydrogenase
MSSPAPSPLLPAFRTVAIAGVGLIGGSIAAALRQRGLSQSIVGLGRNPRRLEAARQAGLIDRAVTDPAAVADADFVVVCTPVDRIAADVLALAAHTGAGALITDAGSVKGTICRELSGRIAPPREFIGSHPLAGSEKFGFEHADARLFEGRVCVVTPDASNSATAVDRVRAFWQALGMRVVEMTPARHDEILALTSHLPHAAAAALASLLTGDVAEFAASGFRDTTRIAGGDPALWAAIFTANREPVLRQIDRFLQQLAELRAAIAANDIERIEPLLRAAQRQRETLE